MWPSLSQSIGRRAASQLLDRRDHGGGTGSMPLPRRSAGEQDERRRGRKLASRFWASDGNPHELADGTRWNQRELLTTMLRYFSVNKCIETDTHFVGYNPVLQAPLVRPRSRGGRIR